jgi:hypothetical protein
MEAGRAIARLGPERVPEPGASYRVSLHGESGHLFATDTGQSLL